MRKAICFLCLFLSSYLVAQQATIRGIVIDHSSKETLIGVSLYDPINKKGGATNSYGRYSLTLPKGKIELHVSYMGYQTKILPIDLRQDTTITFELKEGIELNEVTVIGNRSEIGAKGSQMSAIAIPMSQIKSVPALMGEVDVLKVLQLLPGVQSGTEGSAGMYVRGGGPDQNLVLLDGVPLYNVNHLFGFFSVFNPDAIKNVTLYKGAFPARFSGRLSSVVDVRMKDGDMQKFHGQGSIGLISSKINLEGPIIKGRTSFNFSARRTYFDILARPFIELSNQNSESKNVAGYYFYDINAKLNHIINPNNRLYLSFYSGDDAIYSDYKSNRTNSYTEGSNTYVNNNNIKTNIGSHWGNMVASLRWNSVLGNHLFLNTTFAYNRYRSKVLTSEEGTSQNTVNGSITPEENQQWEYEMKYNSGILDLSGNMELEYTPIPEHEIKAGASYVNHTFKPEVVGAKYRMKENNTTSGDTINLTNSRINAHEINFYVEDNWSIGERLKFNMGVNLSLFSLRGKTYSSLEPRFSGRFLINPEISVKGSYSRMSQYIHLLSNNTISMPTDLWVPTTEKVRPMTSNLYALGLFYSNPSGFECSVEGYYKDMKNIVEYKEGASFLGSSAGWEEKIEQGEGRSYGVEFLVQKSIGKWSGWIGYTLAWADRKFPNGTINYGRQFPAKYDRRHDLSTTLSYQFTPSIDAAASWIFASGNVVTLPLEEYMDTDVNNQPFSYFSNSYTPYIENRNNYRMPSYHRLDLSVNFRKKRTWGETCWNFSIYNAYYQRNPFFLYVTSDGNKTVLKQVTLFPIIPSVTFSVKF